MCGLKNRTCEKLGRDELVDMYVSGWCKLDKMAL